MRGDVGRVFAGVCGVQSTTGFCNPLQPFAAGERVVTVLGAVNPYWYHTVYCSTGSMM